MHLKKLWSINLFSWTKISSFLENFRNDHPLFISISSHAIESFLSLLCCRKAIVYLSTCLILSSLSFNLSNIIVNQYFLSPTSFSKMSLYLVNNLAVLCNLLSFLKSTIFHIIDPV